MRSSQTNLKSEKKGGMKHILENVNVRLKRERPWRCSGVKGTKETGQLNAIPDPGLKLVLEREKLQ